MNKLELWQVQFVQGWGSISELKLNHQSRIRKKNTFTRKKIVTSLKFLVICYCKNSYIENIIWLRFKETCFLQKKKKKNSKA